MELRKRGENPGERSEESTAEREKEEEDERDTWQDIFYKDIPEGSANNPLAGVISHYTEHSASLRDRHKYFQARSHDRVVLSEGNLPCSDLRIWLRAIMIIVPRQIVEVNLIDKTRRLASSYASRCVLPDYLDGPCKRVASIAITSHYRGGIVSSRLSICRRDRAVRRNV